MIEDLTRTEYEALRRQDFSNESRATVALPRMLEQIET
jgi:hypothetical protein